MITETGIDPQRFVTAIRRNGMSIYDPVTVGDPEFWIPAPELQALLDQGMRGISLVGLPLRTRSKVVKENVCKALGYRVPASFKKTKPRFPGQRFDAYTQKSDNLQVWNEELSATRRYVLVRVSEDDVITRVKVVTGEALALFDTTGTLTKKYQARCLTGTHATELISPADTSVLAPLVSATADLRPVATPISYPQAGLLLPIAALFQRLSHLMGQSFPDPGAAQERNRGAALHRLACVALGYVSYGDDGQFPDVRHQLLELKLQTSPTIDLGLVRPDSLEPLDVPMIQNTQIRHCDVRYGIFYGHIAAASVHIDNFFLTTGESFFKRFPQFGGKVLNAKLQIPLPADFFKI